jgi:hypothetical protein
MTAQPGETKAELGATPPSFAPNNTKERALVFIVVFLGFLILAGLTAVVGRIIYLSSTSPAQPAKPAEASATAAVADAALARLSLPQGAVVKSVSVGGDDRLAVYYEAPAGAGIVVVDLTTGAVLRRLDVVPGGEAR